MSTAPTEWPELGDGEELLTNPEETLWRQVHPQRLQKGRVSSDAFEPGSKDDKQLSCSRESKVTATEAHRYHTEELRLSSAGCAAITIAEVESSHPIVDGNPDVASLRAVDDTGTSIENLSLPPGHTYLDYRPFGSSRITKKAKQLAFYASRRGIQ